MYYLFSFLFFELLGLFYLLFNSILSFAVIYGIKIEAIMERTEESISVDMLSRLLVDVHQETSCKCQTICYSKTMRRSICIAVAN